MSRPRRVLFLTTSYPSSEGDPSGHFVRAEARVLARGGADVHVIAPGRVGRRDDGDGIVVHSAGGETLFAWPGALSRARQRPWRLAHALPFTHRVRAQVRALGRVDRAIAHWMVPSAWPLGMAVDGPLEAVAHGGDVRLLCALPSPLRAHIVRALLERTDHLRFVAEALRRQLSRSLPAALSTRLEDASSIRPASFDLPSDGPSPTALRSQVRTSNGRALAVAVGRLVAAKRIDLALRATYEVRDDLHLVVVGEGPELDALKRLDASLAAGRTARVTFVGLCPRSETIAWMRAADVLVHASAAEGSPTAVREARAVGTPVVACDAGDLAAWAEVDPGIRMSPAEPRAIARAVERALLQR